MIRFKREDIMVKKAWLVTLTKILTKLLTIHMESVKSPL